MELKRKVFILLWLLLIPITILLGQTGAISGVVTDAADGSPLAGVTVVIKGTTQGTMTDTNGAFQLTVSDKSVLVFSYLGYDKQEITVGNKKVINIALEENAKVLDEVIVVGYGTQKKVTTTGAITSVSNEELLRAPVAGISNALTGLTSGIQSVQTSGEFGNDMANIRIRGIGTLNTGGAGPLILVDGVERSTYNDIDANEIESLNVLKDASATAVFGVRGANGVILITTRQGKEGKPRVSFTANAAALQPSVLPKMLNSYQYALLRNEAEMNKGVAPDKVTFSEEDIELYRTGADPIFHPDKNWLDELIKPYSFQQSYNVNMSGGIDKMRYFASLGYFNQSGGYHKPEQDFGFPYKHDYDRYNVRMNFDFDLTKDLLFSVKLGNQISNNIYPNGGAYAAFDKATTTAPMSSPGFVDGKIITSVSGFPTGVRVFNPWAEAGPTSGGSAGVQEKQFSNTLNTNVSLKYKMDWLTKGLSVRVMGAYDTYYNKYLKRQKYFPTYSVMKDPNNPGNAIVYKNDDSGPYYGLSENIADNRKWRKMYAEAAIDYASTFNQVHRVTALVLGNLQKAYYPNMEYKLPTAYLGIVGRLTYDFSNKYLTEFNLGYNGSENFPEGKRYGLFPSLSLGWVMTEESFLKDNKFLSFLKLRGSYGEVGNDQIGGERYMYLTKPYTYTNSTWQKTTFGVPGINQNTYAMYKEGMIGNPDVTWERAKKWNVGIDMMLLDQRINITADYFSEKRDNILWALSTVPEIVAVELAKANIGKVENHGYEIEIGYKDKVGNVNYWLKGLYSFARSKILFQDEQPRKHEWMKRTGHPVSQYFGLVCEGFYNTMDEIDDPNRPISAWEGAGLQPGDLKYKDLNSDGLINEEDIRAIGHNNFPEINYSISFGGQWNGFDISVMFQGAGNVSNYFSAHAGAYPFENDWGPAYEWQLERWSQERYDAGEKISYPRLEISPSGHNYQTSSFWVQDASYIRLKNVEIGYNFNIAFLTKLGLKSMRAYLSGNNLYTWKKMKYPMDPDAREAWGRTYPPMRVYNFGLNFQF